MPGSSGDPDVNPMAEMLDRYLSCQNLSRGQIVSGTVVRAGPKEVIVDVGSKCEGIVPQDDLEQLSDADREAIQTGGEVMVYVVNPEDDGGSILLSLARAKVVQDWQEAQELLESQEVIERPAIACNKGGVLVKLGRIRGFVPGSQLALSRTPSDNRDREDRWTDVVGQTLQLKVIEVDRQRNRLILSERAARREFRRSQREELLEELKEGDVIHGRVTNVVDFGAFVDLGGIDGLVHLSELAWRRVSHPEEVVEVGQEVDVEVLSVDQERQRVGLSLKRLQPDPWSSIEERYQDGQLIEGTITHLTKWGAFASIVGDEAIEGLIHISELADGTIAHPSEAVSPGQVLVLRVIGLDAERHRLSLSLKQVDEAEFRGRDWKEALESEQSEPESLLSAALSEAIEPAQGEELTSEK